MNFTSKQIASRRVQVLFQQATRTYEKDPDLAAGYLLSARKIAMSVRMRLPTAYRRRICRKCCALLIPGLSSRVRTRSARELHVVVTCLRCGNQTRLPLKAKNKKEPKIEQN